MRRGGIIRHGKREMTMSPKIARRTLKKSAQKIAEANVRAREENKSNRRIERLVKQAVSVLVKVG